MDCLTGEQDKQIGCGSVAGAGLRRWMAMRDKFGPGKADWCEVL